MRRDSHAETIAAGAVSVRRVLEWAGLFAPVRHLVPDATEADWEAAEAAVPVPFWDDNGMWRCAMQSWLLRSGSRTILVDTCFGHHSQSKRYAHLGHTPAAYLDNLARIGVGLDEVDIVVNTHLHIDHIGWNTRFVDGEWIPTFPNATYLMTQADVDHLDPDRSTLRALGEAGDAILRSYAVLHQQSIAPLLERGVATLWEDNHRIDDALVLELAPGHTPGSAILRLESDGKRALFVGDLIHSPVQIGAPDANSCFCIQPENARRSRRRLLEEAADTGALVVPAHFVGPGAVHIERDGDGFAIKSWASLANI